MARRKNPRNPRVVDALTARLDALWPSRTNLGWPNLSAQDLWRLQFAGLRHLIRRAPPLAERWLHTLEALDREARSTLLSIGRMPAEREAERARLVAEFAQLQIGPGKLKHGKDWGPLVEDVRYVTAWIERRRLEAPPRYAGDIAIQITWWRHRLTRAVWRVYLGRRDTPKDLVLTNMIDSKTAPAAAREVVAAARGIPARRLAVEGARFRD